MRRIELYEAAVRLVQWRAHPRMATATRVRHFRRRSSIAIAGRIAVERRRLLEAPEAGPASFRLFGQPIEAILLRSSFAPAAAGNSAAGATHDKAYRRTISAMARIKQAGSLAGALLLLAAYAASADTWRDIPYERFHRALTMVTPLPDARYVRIHQQVDVPATDMALEDLKMVVAAAAGDIEVPIAPDGSLAFPISMAGSSSRAAGNGVPSAPRSNCRASRRH